MATYSKEKIINFTVNNMIASLKATHKDEYEERWTKLHNQYRIIRLFWLNEFAIGEFIPRFFAILENEYQQRQNGTLCVFLPYLDKERICNIQLIEFVRDSILVPHDNELMFWMYVLLNHYDELDVSQIDKYVSRAIYSAHKVPPYWRKFKFDEKDSVLGKTKMSQIGLKHPYACFAARTSTYNLQTIGTDVGFSPRNMDFLDYEMTIAYLKQEGLATVKMGKDVKMKQKISNCIDYAGCFSDEKMDIYIAANAQFAITSFTGLVTLFSMFGIPVLMVNAIPLFSTYGSFPYTDEDLFIPKKWYSKKKKKFLSFREMIDIEERKENKEKDFLEYGIELIDNTPEEIWMATKEFLARMRGVWKSTDDEIENEKCWEKIRDEGRSRIHDSNLCGTIPYRISSTFLKNNLYLLK